MGSRDGAENRRSGWLQFPRLGELGNTVEPAYSVFDRLKHIHEAPLKNLRRTFWWFRKTFFTKPRSDTPVCRVSMSKDEIVQFFGHHHFEPGWELSYNYHGEVLNLRRVEYVDHERYNWWQVHIRGFHYGDGYIDLSPHFETEPTEHPDAHIDLVGLDVERGMETIRDILDTNDIDYAYIDAPD